MENLGTIVVSLILAGIVALIIRRLVKARQAGKSVSCACCSDSSTCSVKNGAADTNINSADNPKANININTSADPCCGSNLSVKLGEAPQK